MPHLAHEEQQRGHSTLARVLVPQMTTKREAGHIGPSEIGACPINFDHHSDAAPITLVNLGSPWDV